MCGRFTATFEFSDIQVRWNLDHDLPKYTPRFHVAPETSPNIPVIVRHRGGNAETRRMIQQVSLSAVPAGRCLKAWSHRAARSLIKTWQRGEPALRWSP